MLSTLLPVLIGGTIGVLVPVAPRALSAFGYWRHFRRMDRLRPFAHDVYRESASGTGSIGSCYCRVPAVHRDAHSRAGVVATFVA